MVNKYTYDKKLSQHFTAKEFQCKDGTEEILVDDVLVTQLEMLRNQLNKPVKIVSGYRTESYNKQCGGAENSYHIQGRAADIKVEGIDNTLLGLLCTELGFSGVGVYENWVHVDTRPIPYKFVVKGGVTYGQ